MTARQILVQITHDNVQENTELFDLTLSNPHNAQFSGGGQTLRVTGTIVDDDDSSGGGSANRPPVIEKEIPAQTIDAGNVLELDVSRNFYDRERRPLTWFVESSDPAVATVSVSESGTLTTHGIWRGTAAVTVTVADHPDERVSQTFAETVRGPARVLLFPSAADESGRQGFARVVNRSANGGEVRIEAIDDTGRSAGVTTLTAGAGEAVHFNSHDLETGNPDKGLRVGVGPGPGNWRLVLESDLDIVVLSYIRSPNGLMTAMHDVVPVMPEDGSHRVAIFNPASNERQVSRLRLINAGTSSASVTVTGVDDAGRSPGIAVRLRVAAGTALEMSSLSFR